MRGCTLRFITYNQITQIHFTNSGRRNFWGGGRGGRNRNYKLKKNASSVSVCSTETKNTAKHNYKFMVKEKCISKFAARFGPRRAIIRPFRTETCSSCCCSFLCFPSRSVITYKYNTPVDNTTLYSYKKNSIFFCQGDKPLPVEIDICTTF